MCLLALTATVAMLAAPQAVMADRAKFRAAEKDFKDALAKGDAARMGAAADAIGASEAPEALTFLLDTIKRDHEAARQGKGLPGDVRSRLLAATSKFSDEASVEKIGSMATAIASDRTPSLAMDQFDFFLTLATMKESAAAARHLEKALADRKNPYIKAATLEAVRQSKNARHLEAVLKILGEDNTDWINKWKIVPINVFACLEDIVTPGSPETLKVVEALTARVEAWQKVRNFVMDDRVRYFGLRMLNKLTGESADPTFVAFWKWWLVQKKQTNPGPSTDKPADRTTEVRRKPIFDTVPVGRRYCFVIDVSLSMEMPLKINLEEIRKRRNQRKSPVTGDKTDKEGENAGEKQPDDPLERLDWKNINTKFHLATAELARAIKEFPEGFQFAIVTYSTEVNLVTRGWVTSTKENRELWASRASNLQMEALTNIHGGLMRGLRLNEKNTLPPDPATDPDCVQTGADTIIFLTDGWGSWSDDSKVQNVQDKRTTDPKVKIGDGTRIYGEDIWPDIVRHNLFRKVVINTVGIGNHDKELLRILADKTGGVYVDWGFPEG